MPHNHPLAVHKVIRPEHLNGIQFIAFDLGSYTGQRVDAVFQANNVNADVVITTDAVVSVTEFVAGGLGYHCFIPYSLQALRTGSCLVLSNQMPLWINSSATRVTLVIYR